jgi:hypothetical protein
MQNKSDANCAFAPSLLGFLYGEISDKESREFESHILGCKACAAEFSDLTGVRDAIEVWHHELLAKPAQQINFTEQPILPAVVPARQKPSAIAAVRAFFQLSPNWLRAATAAVALLFCASLFVLLFGGSQSVVDRAGNISAPLAIDIEHISRGISADNSNQLVAVKLSEQKVTEPRVTRSRGGREIPVIAKVYHRSGSVDTSSQLADSRDREQLMSDLGLTSNKEEQLPRLSDILEESGSN